MNIYAICDVDLFMKDNDGGSDDDELFLRDLLTSKGVKLLSTNPIKWSNTLEQFVGCSRRII